MRGIGWKTTVMREAIEAARQQARENSTAMAPRPDFGNYVLGSMALARNVAAPFYLAEAWVEGHTDFNPSSKGRILLAAVGNINPNYENNEYQVAEALDCEELRLQGLGNDQARRYIRPHLNHTLVAANGVLVWRQPLSHQFARFPG